MAAEPTEVRRYAGTRYPERPLAFEWESRWLEVADVLRQARTPEGMQFDVLADDHQCYRLEWVETQDIWSVAIRS